MITQSEIDASGVAQAPKQARKSEVLLDFVALGCLMAGSLAIIKALQMHQAVDALICLPASVAACSLICYLYFRRD